jgi:rubrerythrin
MDTLDFEGLSLKSALDLAIIIEDDARDRYEELADQLELHHTEEAAQFFRFMVKQEIKHGDELRERRKRLFGEEPVEVSRTDVPEVETSDYDEARAFMSPHQAFRVALANENRAFEFFDSALKYVKDREVAELFTQLRAEEMDHRERVQKALGDLGPEDTSNPEDFVDEPVGQD